MIQDLLGGLFLYNIGRGCPLYSLKGEKMKIIIGEVGSGKTKAILKESQDKGAPILTDSIRRKEKLLDKAERYGFTIPVPMVVGEDCIPTDGEYIVDNIKTVLEKIFGSKVICGTFTMGDENSNEIVSIS